MSAHYQEIAKQEQFVISMNRSSRNTHVYYLPVGLTNFQQDLIEILISLHAKYFIREISAVDEHDNDNGVEETTMYPKLSSKKMTYVFDHNIRAVANHPCLLVDHYMPRQFLRMEPNEKLINSSDKFQKFQQLLYHIIHRDRVKYPGILKIALISHSVRELDLLEGLILGETVRIKRLSGTSLYDEKHVYFEENQNRGQDMNDSKDGTPSVESSSNSYTGYPRDDYDYSAKRKLRKQKPVAEDWLFLTTTTHLINDSSLLKDYDCDYIISFDPLLDPSLPALTPLNMKASKRIPIIKILVVDSPDHYILANTSTDDSVEYELLKNSIDYFLRSRHLSESNNETKAPIDYKQLVRLLLSDQPITSALPDIDLSGTDEGAEPYQPRLSSLTYGNSQLSIDETDFDMKSYQSELMKKTVDRLMEIQKETKENTRVLVGKRGRETERQNLLDELKHEIGVKFKTLEDRKKTQNDTEKKLERFQTEADKLDRRLKTLQEMQRELKAIVNLSQEDAQKKVDEYKEETVRLKGEVDHWEKSNNEKSDQNDNLRLEYQQKSSRAVEVAQQLTASKTAVEQSQKDLKGPAAELELKSLLAKKRALADQEKLTKNKNKFLKSYINKMSSHYGFKLSANGDWNPHSNSGTPSNSRSSTLASRHKSTRSNTPTYT